jgi:hypothetical protein
MKKSLRTFTLSIIPVIGLPLVGLLVSGRSIIPYLEFPPLTRYINPAPFAWPVFCFYVLLIAVLLSPFFFRFLRLRQGPSPKPLASAGKLPWWGFAGLLFGLLAWVLAWTRFAVFQRIQAHTFTPLWLAYILVINALAYKQTGHCLMLSQPVHFGLLFPLSALFWWLFEFLNRFVQNWYYSGAEFGPWEYFWYATLPFATVLPAVIGTREWLSSFTWPEKYFKNFIRITVTSPRRCALIALIAASAGLFLLGIFPHYLFALLWISPLIIMVSWQALFKEKHLFSNMAQADWVLIVTSALAALICGFFWEMWNFYSLAKWKYQIPFVQRFNIFEMPILGYAGYLPFGLECTLIADLILVYPLNKALLLQR